MAQDIDALVDSREAVRSLAAALGNVDGSTSGTTLFVVMGTQQAGVWKDLLDIGRVFTCVFNLVRRCRGENKRAQQNMFLFSRGKDLNMPGLGARGAYGALVGGAFPHHGADPRLLSHGAGAVYGALGQQVALRRLENEAFHAGF